MEYFFADGNQQQGPYTLEQLSAMGLKPETLVWYDGLPEWKPAGSVPELAPLFAARLPAAAPAVPPAAPLMTPPAAPLPYQLPSTGGGTQNGMAIASLVLGIVALVTILCDGFGLLPGILAIIFGLLARNQIRRSNAQGYGMATAGLICGSIAVSLVVVGILVIFAVLVAHHHH